MLHATTLLTCALLSAPSVQITGPALDAISVPIPTKAMVRATVESLLDSPSWRGMDPSWSATSDREVSVLRFGSTVVVRVRPFVAGREVEAADRILVFRHGQLVSVNIQSDLTASGDFMLSYADAMTAAVAVVPASLITDADRQSSTGLAGQRWLGFGQSIRPVWRVRVPTWDPRDMRDVWVDAETGDVAMVQPAIKMQAAPTDADVFLFSPDPSGLDVLDLQPVMLAGLLPASPGGFLRGEHLETYNCCKKYTCPAMAMTCPVEDRICSDDSATIPPAIESTIEVGVPTTFLPALVQGLFPAGTLYVRTVFCTEQPRLVSSPVAGMTPAGWYPTPVDSTRMQNMADGLASETDAFAELQVYHSTHAFFLHLRSVLEDPGFCLEQESMKCNMSGESLDAADMPISVTAQPPARPFHITTNFLLPTVNQQELIAQATPVAFGGMGRGTDPMTPVEINDFQRIPNAAFIPALDNGPIQIPPELAPLAAQFNRDFDSNLYFQGNRDFAYDGDIVFHEFTHAVVHTLAPALQSGAHDQWGSHVEPGAMNEGWCDYFAASFTNDSATGEYGSAGITDDPGLRNADNQESCPTVLIGEVHQDSLHWSAALWDVRKVAQSTGGQPGVDNLDQALLSTIAMADPDESMDRQGTRILAALDAAVAGGDLDASVRAAAEDAFNTRGVTGCERIWELNQLNAAGFLEIDMGQVVTNPKETLLQPSPGEAGLANYAPGVLQMKVNIPKGGSRFNISWTQAQGGFGGLGGGTEATELRVLVNEGDPINWQYTGTTAKIAAPFTVSGTPLAFDPNAPATVATVTTSGNTAEATFEQILQPDPCNTREFYVAFVSVDDATTMNDIDVGIDVASVECVVPEGDPESGCSCGAASAPMVALAGLLLLRRRRRRRTRG